jgi:hypothetical protein
MNTVLALCERLVGGIHYSWGEKDGSDCSHVVFPLETTVDRFIVLNCNRKHFSSLLGSSFKVNHYLAG